MVYGSGGLKESALYPFTRKAREYVNSLNLSLKDILKNQPLSIELGERRVLDCFEGKFQPKVDYMDESELSLTILSYPIARMIALSIGVKTITEKYASGEVMAIRKFLAKESGQFKVELARELNLDYEGESIPLPTYLHLASKLSKITPKWKLINRVVQSGRVEVDEGERETLLEEAIKQRIMEPVDVKNIPDEIKKRAKNMRVLLTPERQDVKIDKIEENALPPCLNAMLVTLEQGTGSHNTMFTIATFFTNLGLGTEDTLSIFKKSPKYKEDIARYQIEFLSGQKSNTEYTCPTCATLKTMGLCKWDCQVKHPIQYYRQHATEKRFIKTKEK